MTLPTWCSTPIGRALVAEIIATRPEPRLRRHRLPGVFGGYPDGTTTYYPGKPAALLRKLRSEWVDRELAALDRQFAITHLWDQDEADLVIGAEQSEDLIARVLAEAVSERRAA